MKSNIFKARVKRSSLAEYAGKHYRDESSTIINSLNNKGKDALVGIQKEDGIYTIIGKSSVFFSSTDGISEEIPINLFSEKLHLNALKTGKRANFEFLAFDDKEIWLFNKSTMEAMWNIILFLEEQNDSL